jgi:hypothetical protein
MFKKRFTLIEIVFGIAGLALLSGLVFADFDQGNPPVTISSANVTITGGSVNTTGSVDSAAGIHNVTSYASGSTSVVYFPSGATKKFVVTDVVISAFTAGVIHLFDGTDTVGNYLTPLLNLSANGGVVINFKKSFVSATANNTLNYTAGLGATGSILINGYEQ